MHRQNIGLAAFAALTLALSGCSHQPNNSLIYTQAAATIAAELTLTVAAYSPTPEPTATALPTETPEPTAAPMILPTLQIQLPPAEAALPPTEAPATENPYKAEVVSIGPSPNQFLPGQQFTWTISLKNIGTATWSGKYSFSYQNGAQIANQSSVHIDTVTPPGGIMTLNIPATAPNEYGTHKSEWKFARPDGVAFFFIYYNAIVGDTTFITGVPGGTPTATPNTLDWMCSDPNRSNIQQSGCDEYCRNNAYTMQQAGKNCYSYGVHIIP